MIKSKIIAIPGIISALCLIWVGTSCTSESQGGAAGGNNRVSTYAVKKMNYQSVTTHQSFPAVVEGIQTIELRPRIEGYLEKIYVDEGAHVKKGDLLFKINADEYQQEVESAQANVAVAEANLNTAKVEVDKQTPLVKKGIVGEFNLTSAQLELQSAEASLRQAQANLDNARTNLSYTLIKSPADGVIGVFPYRIGSLVSSTSTDPLTMISDNSQVRVYFSVNEKDFLSLTRNFIKETEKGEVRSPKQISLILADGSDFGPKGIIDAASGLISENTGSATIRATFENPEGLLRSGSSATVQIPNQFDSALVIPQSATYEIQNRTFVYVVAEDSTVNAIEIATRPDDTGKNFITLNGLQKGDMVVTEGINSLQASMKIVPKIQSNQTESL